MDRFAQMQNLLDKSKFFKLVCGAGNEDKQEVKKLSIIYTLAGAKGLDISANAEIVKACNEGMEYAYSIAPSLGINIGLKPYITVSVGMPGDHHVRKAFINPEGCIKCDLCIPVCPTDAIPDELIIKEPKCIGCGNCSAICPVDTITYYHNEKELLKVLPGCLEAGAEHIELHAAVAEDKYIMKEWEIINQVNKYNHVSMCLDRLHLSNFALEERVKKAKEISGDRLIIQADGYPMSGGEDDFNTTLQAIAITDVINKKFNKYMDNQAMKTVYKNKNEINILVSGGTNSLTAELARQNDVRFQGISIGTYARKIVKDYLSHPDFYNDLNVIKGAYRVAKELVTASVGEI